MDPKANLAEQLSAAQRLLILTEDEPGRLTLHELSEIAYLAERLSELVLALDEWRIKGGFDPYPNQCAKCRCLLTDMDVAIWLGKGDTNVLEIGEEGVWICPTCYDQLKAEGEL